MKNFDNQVIVITGGATGIGFALAKAFGADGGKILIGEPRAEVLKEAVAQLTQIGIDADSMVLDVTDNEAVEAFADFAWQRFGKVDILFNNAGIGAPRSSIDKSDMDAVRHVFDVNFFGVWHGCRAFSRRMIEQATPAKIYNTGSENSLFVAVPYSAAYIAAKHAVLGLTESLQHDAPDFIHYGVIFPGFVSTPMTAGSPIADNAMDADRFAAIVKKQVEAGETYIVSHAYNVERIAPRAEALAKAYATYAPRFDGDEEYDVPLLIEQLIAEQKKD